MQETWSWGVIIGLPVVSTIALICLGLTIFTFVQWRTTRDPYAMWGAGCLIFGAAAVALIIGLAAGMYPYEAEYHKWVPKQGTVTNVDRRIVGGDSISEKIVVTYEDGNQYGCNDTRCASIRVGDSLTLTCKRTWQYAGVDGYDCNFVELRKAS